MRNQISSWRLVSEEVFTPPARTGVCVGGVTVTVSSEPLPLLPSQLVLVEWTSLLRASVGLEGGREGIEREMEEE